eukprot:CAMPEP_0182558960 /NCGR_PEP_ID=MMETSP1324-20130603/2264_1 /TAXON_ID=236786 /ORGANISM="Florenciella sp., Strain RCC1587" /LENGTH=137 /DNA_ID=CAMNT_0024771175 /DNA_START=233 /DNA_END=643 /DNA_ORIENTATION=+
MSGSEASGGGAGPRYRALQRRLERCRQRLRGRARGDFIGLVPACSDTDEPEHKQRRGAAPCASRVHEGYRTRALDRRNRFAVNRAGRETRRPQGRRRERRAKWRRRSLVPPSSPPRWCLSAPSFGQERGPSRPGPTT